jgi:hypothetical protein
MTRRGAVAVLAMGALMLGGCRAADAPLKIEAHAYVVLCTGASDCFQLPLPHADVLATGEGLARSGVTDEYGIAHFAVIDPGAYTVRVDSFAFEDDYAEATITVRNGRTARIDLIGKAAKQRGTDG